MRVTKVLFFIEGITPSKEQVERFKEIEKNECKVCFRNIKYFDEAASLEDCDFVTGKVPKKYSNKFPVYNSKKNIPEKPKELENESKPKPAVWTPGK